MTEYKEQTANRPEHHGALQAQLRDAIDSGGTGDKIAMEDPAMAPLGTDDEAAGVTAPAEAIRNTLERETAGKKRQPKTTLQDVT